MHLVPLARILRLPIVAALVLVATACQGDTGFQNTGNNTNTTSGQATMTMDPEELVWEDMPQSIARSKGLMLQNGGDGILEIRSVTVPDDLGGVFFLKEEDYEGVRVTEGSQTQVVVVCALPDAERAVTALRISSNDRTRPTWDVTLDCRPEGWEEPDTGDTDGGDTDTGGGDTDTDSGGTDTGGGDTDTDSGSTDTGGADTDSGA